MEERDYWLWLTRIDGFGYKKIKALLNQMKKPYDLFRASEEEMKACMTSRIFAKKDLKNFMDSKNEQVIEAYIARMNAYGVSYVAVDDPEYPEELYGLYEPVYVLYYRGVFHKHRLSIGMVGSRQCSAYGRKVAERFGEDLAGHGVNVISGMARGIDSYSHIGALRGRGFTTAVLGCGINVCYPAENQTLMRKIIQEGCVLSEYGLDVEPSRGTFPLRNRIISALSNGILLVEAKEKSGSLITVDYALDYGKDVFAIPGDVLGRTNSGSNNIIRLGAKPVFEVKDILDEYSIYSNNQVSCVPKKEIILEEKEKIVYSCISLSPIFIDEIARETCISMNELQFLLTKLEIKGAVIQLPNKYYIRDY